MFCHYYLFETFQFHSDTISHCLLLLLFPKNIPPHHFINIPPHLISSQHSCASYPTLSTWTSGKVYYTFVCPLKLVLCLVQRRFSANGGWSYLCTGGTAHSQGGLNHTGAWESLHNPDCIRVSEPELEIVLVLICFFSQGAFVWHLWSAGYIAVCTWVSRGWSGPSESQGIRPAEEDHAAFRQGKRSLLPFQHSQRGPDCYCKTSFHMHIRKWQWNNVTEHNQNPETHTEGRSRHMASRSIPRPTRVRYESHLAVSCCAQLERGIWYVTPRWSRYEFPCADPCLSQSSVLLARRRL